MRPSSLEVPFAVPWKPRFPDQENHPKPVLHQIRDGPHTSLKMHFTTLVHQATSRVRPRSIQFDGAPMVPDPKNRRAASRDAGYRPPAPGTRTSSLPSSHSRYYSDVPAPIRHHRSMMHVVERAPKLPMTIPLSYSELYPNGTAPALDPRPSSRMPLDSQAPLVPGTGLSSMATQLQFEHTGWLTLLAPQMPTVLPSVLHPLQWWPRCPSSSLLRLDRMFLLRLHLTLKPQLPTTGTSSAGS